LTVGTETEFTWGGAREGAGRPPAPAAEKHHSVTITMPRKLRDQLDREARRLGVPRSRLAVAILKRALARRASDRGGGAR
jgi:hypothetical protein